MIRFPADSALPYEHPVAIARCIGVGLYKRASNVVIQKELLCLHALNDKQPQLQISRQCECIYTDCSGRGWHADYV